MKSTDRRQDETKYAILVGDGMADYPLRELNDHTPLEVANTPNMDEISRQGQLGLAAMVPPSFAPASDVAILSILGYNPKQYYTGRGPLEAAQLGIKLGPRDAAFRCNLVTADKGRIIDYSGGHISSNESLELINFLDQQLGSRFTKFQPGVSYRHICTIKNINLTSVNCTPPHDVIGELIEDNLPQGKGAQQLIDLIKHSHELLREHDINKIRIHRGQNPANMIWLWGPGYNALLPSFEERFGIKGGVISAVDLVKGIAKLIGLETIEVPGATGYYDTNYQAKASYALKCLEQKELVFVHVEAPDEASHNAQLSQKIKAIENFDNLIVGPIKKELCRRPARILVLPDHPTSITLRTHTSDPVPFAWCGQGITRDNAKTFSERNALNSALQVSNGYKLIEQLI